MKYRKVILNLRDRQYAGSLGKALSNYYHGLDIVLQQSEDTTEDFADERTLVVIDDPADEDYIAANERRVYKYSSVYCIAETLGIETATEHENGEILKLGFVGLHGGCGCSSISEIIARCAVMNQGKNVLKISLSPFGDDFSSDSQKAINRLMFEYGCGKKKSMDLEGMKYYICPDEYGVYHSRCIPGLNPMRIGNSRAAIDFINELTVQLNINLIVCDFGTALLPGDSDFNDYIKDNYKMIAVYTHEEYADRMKLYENFAEEFHFASKVLNDADNIYYDSADIGCSHESFSYSGNNPKIDMSFGFAMDAAKLTENLLK